MKVTNLLTRSSMKAALSATLLAYLAGCGGEVNDSTQIDSVGGAADIRDTTPGAIIAFQTTLSEWKVDAMVDTVAPGRYRFIARNNGRVTHALEVEGNDDEVETTPIAPGASSEVTLELKPGVYELYCPIKDTNGEHEALGMKRTLVVRSAAPTPQ